MGSGAPVQPQAYTYFFDTTGWPPPRPGLVIIRSAIFAAYWCYADTVFEHDLEEDTWDRCWWQGQLYEWNYQGGAWRDANTIWCAITHSWRLPCEACGNPGTTLWLGTFCSAECEDMARRVERPQNPQDGI